MRIENVFFGQTGLEEKKTHFFEGQKDVMPEARQIFKQIFHVTLVLCSGRFFFLYIRRAFRLSGGHMSR